MQRNKSDETEEKVYQNDYNAKKWLQDLDIIKTPDSSFNKLINKGEEIKRQTEINQITQTAPFKIKKIKACHSFTASGLFSPHYNSDEKFNIRFVQLEDNDGNTLHITQSFKTVLNTMKSRGGDEAPDIRVQSVYILKEKNSKEIKIIADSSKLKKTFQLGGPAIYAGDIESYDSRFKIILKKNDNDDEKFEISKAEKISQESKKNLLIKLDGNVQKEEKEETSKIEWENFQKDDYEELGTILNRINCAQNVALSPSSFTEKEANVNNNKLDPKLAGIALLTHARHKIINACIKHNCITIDGSSKNPIIERLNSYANMLGNLSFAPNDDYDPESLFKWIDYGWKDYQKRVTTNSLFDKKKGTKAYEDLSSKKLNLTKEQALKLIKSDKTFQEANKAILNCDDLILKAQWHTYVNNDSCLLYLVYGEWYFEPWKDYDKQQPQWHKDVINHIANIDIISSLPIPNMKESQSMRVEATKDIKFKYKEPHISKSANPEMDSKYLEKARNFDQSIKNALNKKGNIHNKEVTEKRFKNLTERMTAKEIGRPPPKTIQSGSDNTTNSDNTANDKKNKKSPWPYFGLLGFLGLFAALGGLKIGFILIGAVGALIGIVSLIVLLGRCMQMDSTQVSTEKSSVNSDTLAKMSKESETFSKDNNQKPQSDNNNEDTTCFSFLCSIFRK